MADTTYGRMPALSGGGAMGAPAEEDYPAHREKRCEERTGHQLQLRGNWIICTRCYATWKRES